MKPNATLTAVLISGCLTALGLPLAGNGRPQRGGPPAPCVRTNDSAGRPLEILCFDAQERLVSRTYVDTAGRRFSLPVRLSQPARFGARPEALKAYLRLPGCWPSSVTATWRVMYSVLIGADGRVQDVRLRKGLPQWPTCVPIARRRLQTMPRWHPAIARGKPVPSLVLCSVQFDWDH